MENKTVYQTGEQPPKGTYNCTHCSESSESFLVPEMGDTLPQCSVCGKTQWAKL